MASTEVSIKQLPTISSIEPSNFVIVQTENSTNKLDFKDFVVGLENTTFANTISSSKAITDIFASTPAAATGSGTHGLAITINGVNYNIMLSATA